MSTIQTITLEDLTESEAMNICGSSDRNLLVLSECFDCEVSYRDLKFFVNKANEVTLKNLKKVLQSLHKIAEKNRVISEQDVIYASRLIQRNEEVDFDDIGTKVIGRTLSGKAIAPKTRGQKEFVNAMETAPIVFAIGPAGTGKTFLAVVEAVAALKRGDIKRIVLTRPAVEAGENLGFLPGDLKEKVDPYLTPLYDVLYDMLGVEQTEKLMERGTIEIAPLAYMRGRTLDDSYVILDEAQNTTGSQMKMFLTRLGFHSHMVITGDITQIDLQKKVESGLVQASRILKGIPDIKILELSADDVVRHPLVQKIIERYAKEDAE